LSSSPTERAALDALGVSLNKLVVPTGKTSRNRNVLFPSQLPENILLAATKTVKEIQQTLLNPEVVKTRLV